MHRYLKIYLQLLRLNFQALVVYRGNFVNSMLSSISWGIFSLFSMVLLTFQTPEVFGWKREEIWLLNGLYGILVGLFHMIFSTNMERLSRIIHYGELDFVLLKPADAQFLVSFWRVNYTIILRILMASLFSYYILVHILHTTVRPLTILFFVTMFPISLLLMYSIWFLVMTTLIWFTKLYNLVELMYSLVGLSRYPQEMSRQLAGVLFVVVLPLTFIIVVPTKTLLGRLHVWDIVGLFLFASLLFFVSRRYWRFALKHYSSASS